MISPVTSPPLTQDNTNREETRTNFHISSRMRTHNPSVRAGEAVSCLTLRRQCDQQSINIMRAFLCVPIAWYPSALVITQFTVSRSNLVIRLDGGDNKVLQKRSYATEFSWIVNNCTPIFFTPADWLPESSTGDRLFPAVASDYLPRSVSQTQFYGSVLWWFQEGPCVIWGF